MLGTFKIIECIKSEIEEAEEYIELANMFKVTHPEMAKLYLELAKEEVGHAERLIEFKSKPNYKIVSEDKSNEHAKEMWKHIQPLLSVEVAELRREISEIERSL